MRNKRAKMIRKSVIKSTNILFSEMVANIIRMPLKARAKLAWLILKGVREKNRNKEALK